MRTLEWIAETQQLKLIDQRALPSELQYIYLETYQSVSQAIKEMAVRGAPAIGVAAAFGMALAAIQSKAATLADLQADLSSAARVLESSRPTAVNLRWGLQRMLAKAEQSFENVQELRRALLAEARKMADEDVAINKKMAGNGAELIADGDTIIHHCNTGSLAAVDWGTALGVIRMAHEQGKKVHVLVDETRPRLQGSRLTAWELSQYEIPYEIITDNAAGYFLHSGQVNKVLFGGDRVARNGDVANKIGSYMLALAAHANQIPVYSVIPTSTIDLNLANGDEIPIEERDQNEVLNIQFNHQPAVPQDAKARNPAFDVTPNNLVTALVTERGVIYPPFEKNIAKIMHEVQGAA